MFRIFRKRHPSTASSNVAEKAHDTRGSSPGSHLPRKPGTDKGHWSAEEVALLLECEQRSAQMTVEFTDDARTFSTRVLGIDLQANQILLEACRPALPVSLLANEQPLWLTLEFGHGVYRLCVQPRERLSGGSEVGDIVTAGYGKPRAAAPLIQFDGRGAPRADLQLSAGKGLQATVLRLSDEELELVLQGKDVEEHLAPGAEFECTLLFNSHFRPGGRTRVIGSRLQRAGHRRRTLRLAWSALDAATRAQLRTYIRACERHAGVAA